MRRLLPWLLVLPVLLPLSARAQDQAAGTSEKPAPGIAAGVGNALESLDKLSDTVDSLEHTLPGRTVKGAIGAYGVARALAAASAALTTSLSSGAGPTIAAFGVNGLGEVRFGDEVNATDTTGTTGTTATTASTATTATATN